MPRPDVDFADVWATELQELVSAKPLDRDDSSQHHMPDFADSTQLLGSDSLSHQPFTHSEVWENDAAASGSAHWWSHMISWFRLHVLRSGGVSRKATPTTKTWLERRYNLSGWRVGVLMSCIGVALCLCLETILFITAVSTNKPGEAGQGTLIDGSCADVRKFSTLILVPINIVATTIIGCSNYVMQCMSAPSRRDLDRAHDIGYHVHIGVSSARNNFHNDTIRQLSWWFIGITSIPIHLMLNSAVFVTLQTNNYLVTIVGPEFLEDTTWNVCNNETQIDDSTSQICAVRQTLIDQPDLFVTHSLERCIEIYSDSLQAEASNLFVMTNSTLRWDDFDWTREFKGKGSIRLSIPPSYAIWDVDSFHGAFVASDYRPLMFVNEFPDEDASDDALAAVASFSPNAWLCDPHEIAINNRPCTASEARARASGFTITPTGIPIYECQAQKADQHCSLEYSVVILAITMGCDLVKLAAMVVFFRRALQSSKSRNKDDELIATLGDAIQSYLDRPDPVTVDRCLMDQIHIRYQTRITTDPNNFRPINLPMALRWKTPTTRRWVAVPSMSRWICFVIPYSGLAVGTGIILYWNVVNSLRLNIFDIWNQGIGKVDPNAIFTSSSFSDRGILRGAVTVNTPQLLFSYFYFVYNGIFTCMHIGKEWGQFARRPTFLRVSKARGSQKWTYWLSLPWRYSIPLITLSALLHWLVSRSLYLVRVNVLGPNGRSQSDFTVSAFGFSPLATILVMSVLVLMLVVVLGFCMRKLEPGMPLVGTNSFAISASCHDEGGEKDAALKALTWGVVSQGIDNGEPGHATVTSRATSKLIVGRIYQ